MPLRADRVALEWMLRVAASLAMAGLLAGAFRERKAMGGAVVSPGVAMATLDRWATSPPADTLGLEFVSAPAPEMRDYLRALRANGTVIAWANGGIPAVVVEVETLQDPAGGAIVRVTGEPGSILTLSDSLGVLDSLQVDAIGATMRVPAFSGNVATRAGSTVASTPPIPGPAGRSVVIVGLAGWESKFTILALEERGWRVESWIGLAPRLGTARGNPFPLDTARHAAVVALDSSAVSYARDIQRFVRSGGGLVLGEGASPYMPRVAPAGLGELVRPTLLASDESDSRSLLGFRILTPLREGARGLERRSGRTTLAAWRLGAGRVLQSGYRDTWRWRMEGGENAVADHRAWWAGLVATVAYRPSPVEFPLGNPAPLATLTAELGPPRDLPLGQQSRTLWPIVLAVLVISLFAEWLSRRLRGAA